MATRSAPAVAVELDGSTRWSFAVRMTAAAAFAAAVAAVCGHLEWGALGSGACIAAAGIGGMVLGRPLSAHRPGRLRWDGAQWWWRPEGELADGHTGQVHVVMDFGRWMLLRFDPDAAGQPRAWLPVPGARLVEELPLRAAVYCRRPSPSNLRVADANPDERR